MKNKLKNTTISATIGGAAGVVASKVVGGVGVTALGSAVGIGIAPFAIIGAIIGGSAYLIYKGIKS